MNKYASLLPAFFGPVFFLASCSPAVHVETSDKAVWQAWTTEQLDSRRFSNKELEKNVQHIFKKLTLSAGATNATASSR